MRRSIVSHTAMRNGLMGLLADVQDMHQVCPLTWKISSSLSLKLIYDPLANTSHKIFHLPGWIKLCHSDGMKKTTHPYWCYFHFDGALSECAMEDCQ